MTTYVFPLTWMVGKDSSLKDVCSGISQAMKISKLWTQSISSIGNQRRKRAVRASWWIFNLDKFLKAGKSGLADTILGYCKQGHNMKDIKEEVMCTVGSGVRGKDVLPVSHGLWRGALEKKIV